MNREQMTDRRPSDRFKDAVQGLLPAFEDSNDILGLAVSGGPDSLALLLLAQAAYPQRIAAATVDHGLRPEAADECAFVARLCTQRDIPHRTLTPTSPISGSIQAEARKMRYALLKDWMENEGISWLATAHHADDQLETLIMRLLRGSGIDGLSAIRERRGTIIRPVLHFTKDELAGYVAAQNIVPVSDPSNSNPDYDRVRVRTALAHLDGFDSRAASKSAAAVNDARAALQWTAQGLKRQYVTENDGGCALDIHRLPDDTPHDLMRRLILQCLHIVDPSLSPRGTQLEQLIAALKAGETATIGDILCKGGNKWSFSPAPPRQNR